MPHAFKRFALAVMLAAIAIPTVGDDTTDLIEKGRALWASKDYEAAAGIFNRIIETDPQCVMAYYGRGMCHAAKNEFDEALRDLDEVIRFDPTSARGFRNRGSVLCKKKDFDRGIADLTEAIRLIKKKVPDALFL